MKREHKRLRGIYEYPAGSGRWWIQLFYDGRRHREYAGTRGMAVDLLDKRRVERLRNAKLPETVRRPAVTVKDLLDTAAAHVRQHYSTQRVSKKSGGVPATDSRYPVLVAAFGARPAAALKPQEIEQGLARLAAEREWANATINRHQAFLSLAYRLGIDNGKVTINPARLVRRRREDNARLRWLTVDEEAKLRAVIREHWPEHEPELDLALNTGLRQGSMYGLRWCDVDLERGQIAIGRSKNGSPHYAPINSAARAALLRLKALAGDSPWVIVNGETAHSHYRGIPRRKPRNWFEPAVKKAAIPALPWHALRHTYASRLVMAGVDLRTVQELMGHRTIQMTCRYAHLAPQHGLDAAERLVTWSREQGKSEGQTATPTATGDFAAPAESVEVQAVQ